MCSAMKGVNRRYTVSRSVRMCTDCPKMPAGAARTSMVLSRTTTDLMKMAGDRRRMNADTGSTATDRPRAVSCKGSVMPDRAGAMSCRPKMMSDGPKTATDIRGYGLTHRRQESVRNFGDIASLSARLQELERRRDVIDTALRNIRPLPRLSPEVVENRLAEWRRLLRQSTTQARAVLQRVLRGRIVFTPSGEGYTFEAPTRFNKLFIGVVVLTCVYRTERRGRAALRP